MRRLRPMLVCAVQSLGAAACGAGLPQPNHPIIGTWRLPVPGVTCTETWEFRPDGTAHTVSAGEETTADYAISDRPVGTGYYFLSHTVRETNGQRDCLGNLTPVGVRARLYLFPTSDGGFMLCFRPMLEHCVGPMRRIERPG
jgi:hypothetical protein